MTNPALTAAVRAIYGESLDPRELAKNIDPSDVHTLGAPSGPTPRHKAVAAGLGLGAAADAVATRRAFQAARSAPGLARPAEKGIKATLKALGHTKGGKVAEAGLQAANLGLGLTAARELLHRPKPPATAPVTKAARVRLKPINALQQRHVDSGRSRRPSLKPIPQAKAPTSMSPTPRSIGKSYTWTGTISKLDEERRQVFGWANLSEVDGEPVVDLQGDYVPLDEIEKAAYRYVQESRKGGDMHERVGKGFAGTEPRRTADMIESFIVTPDKLEKMGLPHDALPLGWWTGFQVNDEDQWQLVKAGKRGGFSVHGSGTRKAVTT